MASITITFPVSGLTVAISVRERITGNLDFSGTMANTPTVPNIGPTKSYTFEFTEVANTDYIYVATAAGGYNIEGTIYRDTAGGSGGLTTEEHTKLFSLENSTGGGGNSSQAIQTSILNAKKEILEKIETDGGITRTLVTDISNENQSHNKIANNTIITTIKETEDYICKDIKESKSELMKDNVTTRQLVRQKAKKQEEYIQKQLDSEVKTQKMIEDEADSIESLIEQNIEFEADEIERQIQEQIEIEINEIESNQSNDGNNNGTAGEVQGSKN